MLSANGGEARRKSVDIDPYSKAEVYYGDESERKFGKNRSLSQRVLADPHPVIQDIRAQRRRGSVDAASEHPRRFLIPVESTLNELLSQEDSDKNCQITIDDEGPKVRDLRCPYRR